MGEFFVFMLIGMFAGASAGLLGLGGGLITVPALLFVFHWQDMASPHVMHIAVATSLMTITVTSLSSMLAHHKVQNIDWYLFRGLVTGLLLGGFIGAYSATLFSSSLLQRLFAIYAFIMAIRLWLPISVVGFSTKLLARPYLFVAGTLFGSISALVGMGGGTMTVPYLVMAKQTIHKAIGTSAACGFPIALSAIIGFMFFETGNVTETGWQSGYINWTAFLGIISTSSIFAQLAARCSTKLDVVRLRQVFSIVLILVSIDLFMS